MAVSAARQATTYDEQGGQLTEKWCVWDSSGTAANGPESVLVDLRAATGLPSGISSDLYPRKPYAGTFAQTSVATTLRLRNIDVTRVPVSLGWMAELNLRYTTKYVLRNDNAAPKALLPVSRSVQGSSRPCPIYRDLAGQSGIPAGSALQSSADIGGTSLDERGNPLIYNVAQYQITLTSIIDSFQTDISVYDAAWSVYGETLNSSAFMGIPAYSALMKDISFQHLEEEYYTARISYVYDTFGFFEQVAEADTDGKPKLRSTDGRATTVKWKRPNVNATNWNVLLPAGWTKDRLYKGEYGVTP